MPMSYGPGWSRRLVVVAGAISVALYQPVASSQPSGEPVGRIAITHFHPDHVWGGEIAREVTGAPVHQGRLDYEQCERVWGASDWPERIAEWFRLNGVPAEMTEKMLEQSSKSWSSCRADVAE